MGEKKNTLVERILAASPNAKRLSDLYKDDPNNPLGHLKAPSVLSDKQWSELSKWAGMPDSERIHLEHFLRHYINNKEGEGEFPTLPPAETRDQLLKLAAESRRLHKGLEDAFDNDLASRQLTRAAYGGWEGVRLFALSDELEGFAIMVEHVAEHIDRAKPGTGDTNLAGLVYSLGLMWAEHTGIALSTSNKRRGPQKQWNAVEFIIKAAKIADPSLDESTIRNLVKTQSSAAWNRKS